MAGTCGFGEELSGSMNAGNFLRSCKVYWLASQEGLCFMEYYINLLAGYDVKSINSSKTRRSYLSCTLLLLEVFMPAWTGVSLIGIKVICPSSSTKTLIPPSTLPLGRVFEIMKQEFFLDCVIA